MKSFKKLLILSVGALLAATSAQAQVEINISGGVAFRQTFYTLIRNLYGANLASQNPADGAGVSSSSKVTWSGQITNLFGNQTVTIRAFYNGAIFGIQDLTQNTPVAFLASSTPGNNTTVNLQADIGYSSVFQQTTIYTTPVLENKTFAVSPIQLIRSTVFPAGITNVTAHQLRVLAANGALPAWFFTGNTNDTQLIYWLIRDPSSGQRFITFKDIGFTGSPISYFWNTNTSSYAVDLTGRTSGQIVTSLSTYSNAISYLAQADAFNVNNGQNALRFNGALPFVGPAFSSITNDYRPVINGQYEYWYYEQLFTRTTASANVKAFRDALLAAIDVNLQTSPYSIAISRMRVERSSDGAPVAPLE